ncbi:MAG: roadblock/LC7 domain-containing protein [Planctomycetes bacterium]|nr:roadblock/LC7 domain-containing protein [Planctomycetota bacterium]
MAMKPSETDQKLRKQRLIFYEDDIGRINKALENYQNLSKSRCNMLIDVEGHPVTQVGSTEGINLETIAALVAASFAATKEVAKILGETEFSSLTHQGKNESIQLSIVGDRTILATIFDSQDTTVGMVMFYTKELVEKLNAIFNEIKGRKDAGPKLFNDDFKDMSGVLDDMFGDV